MSEQGNMCVGMTRRAHEYVKGVGAGGSGRDAIVEGIG